MRWAVVLVCATACGRFGFDSTHDGGATGDSVDADPTIGTWAQVFANAHYTCAIKDDASAWCLGADEAAQLGTGDTAAFARQAGQLPGSWRTLGLGRQSACGIQTDGTLWCWGDDFYDEVPDGVVNMNARSPVKIGTDTTWVELSIGSVFGCARKQDNTLWCWGTNGDKEYDPSVPTSTTPRMVRSNVRAVATGLRHTHVIDQDGTMWVSGLIESGEGGTGQSYATYSTFFRVGTDSDWRDIDSQLYRTCATKADTTLWCTGNGGYGANGTNSESSTTVFVRATGTGFTSPLIGYDHTCARGMDGSAWCWGSTRRNQFGTFPANFDEPTSLGPVRSLAVGDHHTCLVTVGGALRCSGVNHAGQILWPPASALVPTVQSGTFDTLDVRVESSCGLTGGALSCWGSNDRASLGTGDFDWQQTPASVPGNWTTVAVGASISLGITGGQLRWWGLDPGSGAIEELPTATTLGFSDFTAVASGLGHACAVRGNGDLYCWGDNAFGQVGVGNTSQVTTPQLIGTGYTKIAAGDEHTCGLTGTTIRCWGRNYYGQVGNNSMTDVSTPTTVICAGCNAKTVRQLVAGQISSCALMADNTLYCWGSDFYGEFGRGTSGTQELAGIQATPSYSWASVAMGDVHMCGVTAGNQLYCWGHGDEGQIGTNNLPSSQVTPVQITTTSDWKQAALGRHLSCALKMDGTRYCWGANAAGVYGNGAAWVTDFTTITPDM